MIRTDNIKQMSRTLRLGVLAEKCDSIIHNAQQETPTYQEFLEFILESEIKRRQERDEVKRMKRARLPRYCDLDAFDFNFSAGMSRHQLKELRELNWLEQAYNIILVGPSGTGKTFVASGLTKDAVKQGYNAYCTTMQDLISVIRMKDLTPKAMATYNRISKAHLLAIDDIMLMPMKKEEALGFFNLVSLLHEKSSIIITTNKTPTEWAESLNDEVLATALLDRLLYRCEVIKLTGNSYRMENRKTIFSYNKTDNK